jgi:hypothetical protein
MKRMKLERTNSILAILNQAKNRLNVLVNTWPCGLRSIDDETDAKIKALRQFIEDLESRIEVRP